MKWPDPSHVGFVASAVDPRDFPAADRPELVVAGRSNVGKSSLINTLIGRKQLAKVSSTPGKTRTINFFDGGGEFWLVDLPGYGFAKRSKAEREQWRRAIERYLGSRPKLMLMLLLVDIRRGPEEEEEMLADLLSRAGITVVVVLTKADKLSKAQRRVAAQKLAAMMGPRVQKTIAFSSHTGEGRQAVIEEVLHWLGPASR